MQKLLSLKQNYFKEIDNRAKNLAKNLVHSNLKDAFVTNEILKFIIELYNSENKSNSNFIKEDFKSSSHQAITSDFEFFISRILYHYSKEKKSIVIILKYESIDFLLFNGAIYASSPSSRAIAIA